MSHTDTQTDQARDSLSVIFLEKVEPEQNAWRYYVLSIEPTLFDDVSLVREWGRIGQSGRRIVELLTDTAKAKVELETWLARKRRRGYAERAGHTKQGACIREAGTRAVGDRAAKNEKHP